MAGHAKFGRKKEEAIIALLTQTGVEQAARAAGIGSRTLFRWLEMQEFQAAYLKARRNAFGHATARLQQASGAAASTLLKIMLDKDAPTSSRLRAEVIFVSPDGTQRPGPSFGSATACCS